MRWSAKTEIELSRLCVPESATVMEALRVIDRGSESITFVCSDDGRVLGLLTDGDIRRALLSGIALEERCLPRIMRRDFAQVAATAGRAEVLDIMRAREIAQLPVIDDDGRLCGLHTVAQMLSVNTCVNAAVILAGGRGARLYPLTESIPKPMVTVAGRPILERIILHLMSCGIRRFYISVNYLAEIIETHFGDGSRFGCRIEYLRETQPLGTGGPLSLLDPVPDISTVVVNGDLVTQCDVTRMLDFHEQGGYWATIGLRPYSIPVPFGVATVENGRVVELREKPTERHLINAGIYVLSPEAIRSVPKDQEYPITQLFADCMRGNLSTGGFIIEDEWIDIGRPDELRRANGYG
jgi:dTDP-glucose pyrophosphorylase/predicted transcriptional regulator